MLNKDKNLRLYYSISEVARMLNVNESTLRFWEKAFPQIKPKKAPGRGVRQYRQEDIELLKQIHYLVKVRGMTLTGARQRLKDNKAGVELNVSVTDRLKAIREELVRMRDALNAFTYDDVEKLRQNIEKEKDGVPES